MLEVWARLSPHAHAKFCGETNRRAPNAGDRAVCRRRCSGLNDVGAVRHAEILLADNEVLYHGQHRGARRGRNAGRSAAAAAAKAIVE